MSNEYELIERPEWTVADRVAEGFHRSFRYDDLNNEFVLRTYWHCMYEEQRIEIGQFYGNPLDWDQIEFWYKVIENKLRYKLRQMARYN